MPEDIEETGLLVVLLAVAGAMVYKSSAYGETAGLFPRLTGGVVVIGSLLLLLEGFLPKSIRSIVSEPANLFEASEGDETAQRTRQEPTADADVETEDDSSASRPVPDSIFTTASIVGYTVSAYYIGLLWMSPVFAFFFSRWYRQPWWVTGFLTILSFVLAYGFMELLNLPLDEGALVQYITFTPREVVVCLL
ncbi:tripartite tricarboxylate transporter TctB family protein [Halorussus salinisoli]|uniref:tripartite tricarboxylate transporter TctB family protein n=1 Tax=Halorussus salinisoli TaxID=2558242 RepID=UPI0010C1CC15|nr:tripartite tricarboxylate transporter TctB family protein [Halorussus salinisoli]